MKILVIGQSHIHALKLAYESDQIDWPENLVVEFIPLRAEEYFSIFLYPDREDHAEKTRELVEKIKDSDAVLISFYGTVYNVIGLANDPVPFDFICSQRDADRSDDGITYIPKTLMDLQMQNYSFKIKGHIETLIGIMPDKTPIYYVGNPPPVGSEAYILTYPAHHREKFEELGVSPPEMRLKLWQLHEKTIKAYCADADIEYLPAPKSTLDKMGMLKDAYCAPDPIHANAAYGQLILKNVIGKSNKKGLKNER